MKKTKQKRKIVLVTGTRAEFSYYSPILREIERRGSLDYGVVSTNMHLLDSFGTTQNEIIKGRFKIEATVHNTFDGYDRLTMTKSLGVLFLQLPEILLSLKADMVLVAGDRGEQFVAATVGAHLHLPVAHIQGGELSGNIDGTVRHAITKLSHLHFVSNRDAYERVRKMGEEPFRVHEFGAPQLDELLHGEITDAKEIYQKFSLNEGEPVVILLFHPVTEEFEQIENYTREVVAAVNELGFQTVAIAPNSDAGSRLIRGVLERERRPFVSLYPNLSRADYAGLMKIAKVLVGNSSSGILEAPSFHLPVVNVGNREAGRIQGANVLNAGYARNQILAALKKAVSSAFIRTLKNCMNPYGDGLSAPRIVNVLESVAIDQRLLIKKMTY